MAKYISSLDNIYFSKAVYKDNLYDSLLNGNLYVLHCENVEDAKKMIMSLSLNADKHFVVNKTNGIYIPKKIVGKIGSTNINKQFDLTTEYKKFKDVSVIKKDYMTPTSAMGKNVFLPLYAIDEIIINKVQLNDQSRVIELMRMIFGKINEDFPGYKNKKLIIDISHEFDKISSMSDISINTYKAKRNLYYIICWFMKYQLQELISILSGYEIIIMSTNGLIKMNIDKVRDSINSGRMKENLLEARFFRHLNSVQTGEIILNDDTKVNINEIKEITKSVADEVSATKAEMEIIHNTDDTVLEDVKSVALVDTYVKSVVNEKSVDKALAVNKVISDIKTNMKDKAIVLNDNEKKYQSISDNVTINEKTKDDITAAYNTANSIQETKIEPSIPTDLANNRYIALDKSYEKNVKEYDIKKVIKTFANNKRIPLYITNVKVEDTSDVLNHQDTYHFTFVDKDKVKATVKVNIPKLIDDTFIYIGGNKKVLFKQISSYPITKVDGDVIITTNYNKVFMTLKGGKYLTPKEGKIISGILRLKKEGNDLNGLLTFGNCFEMNLTYGYACNDFNNISRYISKIKTSHLDMNFNLASVIEDLDKKPRLIQIGVFNEKPLILDGKTGELVFDDIKHDFIQGLLAIMEKDEELTELKEALEKAIYDDVVDHKKLSTTEFINVLSENEIDGINKILDYDKSKFTSFSSTYVKMMDRWMALVHVLMCTHGLYTVLSEAEIKYNLSYKIHIKEDIDGRKRPKYNKDNQIAIECNDGFIIIDLNSETNAALVTPLMKLDLTPYKLADLEKREYCAFIMEELTGAPNLPLYIDNFANNFIDAKTESILVSLNIPSDYLGVFLYANNMLVNGMSMNENDLSQKRIRGTESLVGILYDCLAKEYGEYTIRKKRGNQSLTFSVNPNCVIQKLHELTSMEDFSTVNPITEEIKKNTAQAKGHIGMNVERAFTLSKRLFDPSYYGIFGVASPYGAGVGISKQLVIDPNIKDVLGMVSVTKKEDVEKLPLRKLLTPSEAIIPLTLNHDDAPRLLMGQGQNAQTLPVAEGDPMHVTYGYDSMIPKLSADFVVRAKQDGVIYEMDNHSLVVKYADGTFEAYTSEVLERNSGKSFYINNDMILNDGIKKGVKFKKEDVLMYNKYFFKKKNGELIYVVGAMLNVAIMSGDALYEDSVAIASSACKKTATKIVKRYNVKLQCDHRVNSFVNVGDNVKSSDTLLSYTKGTDNEYLNNFLSNMDDEDSISTMKKRNKVAGRVYDIKIFYSGDTTKFSPSILSMIKTIDVRNSVIEKNIKTYGTKLDKLIRTSSSKKVPPRSKVGGFKIEDNEIVIEFFVESTDYVSIGDKVSVFSALKGITSVVIPDKHMPVGIVSGKRADIMMRAVSLGARKIHSIHIVGAMTRALRKLGSNMQDMLKARKSLDEIFKYMYSILYKIEPNGYNVKIYKNKIDNMSNMTKIQFIETGFIRMFIDDMYTEPKLENCLRACEELGVPTMEKLTLPFLTEEEDEDDNDDPIVTDKEMLFIEISVKRLYQIISKENSISSDITHRDKTNQVMGDSKSARISDVEVMAGLAQGVDLAVKEMMTVRADYTVAKDDFYNEIMDTGEVEDLPVSIHHIENKQSLQTLFWMYYGMWINTNIMEL